MWNQEMQVLCDRNYLSWFNHFSWWYQDEFHEDESNHQLEESQQCSWCMIISWIYEFLLMIHTTLLEDCMISCELDEEDHEVFMRCHVWTCVQWFEEMIYNCSDTCSLQFWSWMCFWSWLVQSCSERCALTIW